MEWPALLRTGRGRSTHTRNAKRDRRDEPPRSPYQRHSVLREDPLDLRLTSRDLLLERGEAGAVPAPDAHGDVENVGQRSVPRRRYRPKVEWHLRHSRE